MKTGRWLIYLTIVLIAFLIVFVGNRRSAPAGEFGPSVLPEPSYTGEGAEACLVCHSGEKMQAVLRGPHGVTEAENSPPSTNGCESCHGPGSFHVSRAHGGKGFPLLLEFGDGAQAAPEDDQIAACQACHAEAVGRAAAVVFDGSPHDGVLTCTECHAAHVEVDPMRDEDLQIDTCAICHGGGDGKHPPVDGEMMDIEGMSCSDCHEVHD